MLKSRFILIVIVFICISCSNQKKIDKNQEELNLIANQINNDAISVKSDILNLALSFQYKISFTKEINWNKDNKYHVYLNSFLYSTNKNNQSSVYCPVNGLIPEHLKETVINTEPADSFFYNVIKNNLLISQVYYLDTNSFLRIYPGIDVLNYIKEPIDLTRLICYQKAMNKPLKDNMAYWVSNPFADPFGRGWVISCTEPIYYRDNFIGIISGDMSLLSLKEKYLSSNTEKIILINTKGNIICCTNEASDFINIPQYRQFQYYEPITENIYIFDNPSLLEHKNANLRNAILCLLSGKEKKSFYMNSKKYVIYKSHIKELNWFLLKISN